MPPQATPSNEVSTTFQYSGTDRSIATGLPTVLDGSRIPADAHRHRIGVLLGNLGNLNRKALKYLIVHINSVQNCFEFEILPTRPDDPAMAVLAEEGRLENDRVRSQFAGLRIRTLEYANRLSVEKKLAHTTYPEHFIVITVSRLSDYWYSLSSDGVRLIALGDWDKHMAPPSLLEAIVPFVLRGAIGFASPSLGRSMHLGTKGCLFDFTDSLDEARFKVLNGYICGQCQLSLAHDGNSNIADQVQVIAKTSNWIGTPDKPTSPAGIIAKLGYNLFLTKGVAPTPFERIRATLQEDGFKELVKVVIGALALAYLAWLGIATGGGNHP